MTAFVVDTNVAVVANRGPEVTADLSCQLKCVERLQHLIELGTVAIDETGLVLEEYAKRLGWSGGPGVGSAFFKYIHNYQHLGERVRRVAVTQSDDDRKGFEELPENTFDRADRMFLAVAVVANAVVLNATDSDWCEHEALMYQLEVEVHQLCPEYLERKRGGGR